MTDCTLWQDWLDGGSTSPDGCRRFLWIHGLPGSGKTILASYLNEQLAEHCCARGNSFYYCLHEHNRDETESFLRYVVGDMCHQLGNFIPMKLREMWKYKRMGVDELKECLRVVTQEFSRQSKRAYIIVDAVDESLTPYKPFLRILMSIGTDPTFNHVSLLLTSRDYPAIREAFKKLPQVSLPFTSGPNGTRMMPLRPLLDQADSEIMPTLSTAGRLRGSTTYPQLPPPNRSLLEQPLCGKDPVCGHFGQARSVDMDRDGSDQAWYARDSITPPPQPSPTKPDAPGKRLLSGEKRSQSPTRRRISKGGSHVAGDVRMDVDEMSDGECSNTQLVPPYTSLSMANNFVREAIAAVIDKRLQESGRFGQWPRENFIPLLRYKLADRAAGIFRAVACYLDLLDRQEHLIDDDKILEAIDRMPNLTFEQYERILVTGIPDVGDLNRHSRDFARTALALACSDTAGVPDVDVLVEASRFSVPQGRAQAYNLEKLNHLLGCLVKVTRLRRKPAPVFTRKEEAGDLQRLTVAHYTVKEYLYSQEILDGPAQDFALSSDTNRRLELKIVFYGLQQFVAERRCPTKYEEYCMKMTDKALSRRPAIIVKDQDIWEAVHPCLAWNDAHQNAVNKNRAGRLAFPTWHRLATVFTDGNAPEHRHTCIIVSLLLLEWPKLAEVYLGSLNDDQKEEIWQDQFALNRDDATTVLEMCVSARRLDFLNIFVDAGAVFEDAEDILYRALEKPYSTAAGTSDDGDDGSTTAQLLHILLQRGANPNPTTDRKWTPLQIAVRNLEPYWVQELLYHGAVPHARGDGGDGSKWYQKTPMQICRDAKPHWANDDDDDENLRWARTRVRRQLTAELKEAGIDPAEAEDAPSQIIELLDD